MTRTLSTRLHAAEPSESRHAPARGLAALAAALSLAAWYAALATLPSPGGEAHPPAAHVAGVAIQLMLSLGEAAALVLIAQGLRVRLPYARTLAALLAISLLQAAALHVQAIAWESPALRAWLAPLAGPGVFSPPGSGRGGFDLAFMHAGLLTAARVALTAEWMHRYGCPRGRALAAVTACYLAARLITWWSADLLRGASLLG